MVQLPGELQGEEELGVLFGLTSICTAWDWPREEQTGWINLPRCPVITGPRIS